MRVPCFFTRCMMRLVIRDYKSFQYPTETAINLKYTQIVYSFVSTHDFVIFFTFLNLRALALAECRDKDITQFYIQNEFISFNNLVTYIGRKTPVAGMKKCLTIW